MVPLLKVGVVGATGMVGREFLKVLDQRRFPVEEMRLFAGQKSEGASLDFRDKTLSVNALKQDCFDGLHIVFFSAGESISQEWAPQAVQSGAFAIDNSAAFRMNPEVVLVVPEVNGHKLSARARPTVIANPNCSTIQLVVALSPLKTFGLERVQVASYQSVSGAGKDAVDELVFQTKQMLHQLTNYRDLRPQVFPHPIAFTNLPQVGPFEDSGYCGEEVKIMQETRKILELEKLPVSVTTVRTPTLNSHSEAVWVTLKKDISREEFLSALRPAAGIEVMDDPSNSCYPTNSLVTGQDPVFVGRIRKDLTDPKTWLMWVVADNIRKGAALNAVQIAETVFDSHRV